MSEQLARRFSDMPPDLECQRIIPGSRVATPRSKATSVGINPRGLTPSNAIRDYLGSVRERTALGTGRRKVLIVGAGPVGRSIARGLREEGRTEVCGFLDDYLSHAPEVLGRMQDLPWVARAEFIDEVIVALPSQSAATAACEIAQRNHLDIRSTIALPEGFWPKATVDRISEVPVVSLHRETFPYARLLLKRIVDVAAALVGLALVGPVMALLALLVRLDSRGPAIYSSERIGMRGHPFRCYKFRSMVEGADRLQESLRSLNQRQGPIFKIVNDPRITRVGSILRRHNLDELPQLWNVLRGDMSLVGPRPHPIEDVMRYELQHYARLDMKPGLTGLWQITARKNPSFELAMHLDLTYIENWTLRLDLQILLRTLRVLFSDGD